MALLLAIVGAGCTPPVAATAPVLEASVAAVEGLATMVPADVTQFAEVRRVQRAVDGILAEGDVHAMVAAQLGAELDLSPRLLERFSRSIEDIGIIARTDTDEVALVLLLSRVEAATELLQDRLFHRVDDAPAGAERYVLSDEGAQKWDVQSPPTISVDSAAKLLVVGAPELADAIAEVNQGRRPALSTSERFIQAQRWMDDGAALNAYFDIAAALDDDDESKARKVLDAVLADRSPVVASLRLQPEQRLTVHASLSGTAMPSPRLYTEPPPLRLANRLPAETIGYQAYATKFGLRGRELRSALVDFASTFEPNMPAMVRALEGELELSLVQLLETLGDQGVLGLMAPPSIDVTAGSPMQQLGVAWIQQLGSGDELVRRWLSRVASELEASHVVRVSPGAVSAIPRAEQSVFVEMRVHDGHLLVAAGQRGLVGRAVRAFERGEGTLSKHAAHQRLLKQLQGSQTLMWIDTARALSMFIDAVPTAGRRLALLQRFGDVERVSGALAVGWRVEGKRWDVRLDIVDIATMGALSAVAIYGVRRYLASAKVAEAKSNVGAFSRAAVAARERTGQLCASAQPVPADGVPAAVRHQPSARGGEDFQSGDARRGWRCLGVTLEGPHYYRYHYNAGGGYLGPARGGPDPGPGGFEVAAEGDLDGDGVTSLFTVTGNSAAGEQAPRTIFVSDEFE